LEIGNSFLIIGLLMTLAGVILIYKSLRASPHEIAEDNGVRYIGPIPIVVNGGRKWILAALIITSVLIVYLLTKSFYPEILGGVFGG
jgi:uncharacterized membrane protein